MRKLVNQFKFNFYEISGDLDVFVAFETMNNRGKKLSNLELLKNRLIYLSTKFSSDETKEALRADINNSWKTIYEFLGKNKDEPLDDDEFLKNHWIMNFKYSRNTGNVYIDFLLKELFTTQKVSDDPISVKTIKDYAESLQKSVRHWYFIHNPQSSDFQASDDLKKALDRLKRIGFGAFRPLLMSIFSRAGYDENELLKLLDIMEKFIFLIFNISQRRSNTGDSEFYGWAKEYTDRQITIADMIGKKENDDRYSGIVWWIVSYFDIKSFKLYLDDKFKNREGYYSWDGLRYFLFEYEQNLQSESRGNTAKINWLEFQRSKKDFVSIEHILPQKPSEECWQSAFSGFDDKQLEKITNSLGNLVPLSVSKNAKLQNFCFDIKKKGEDKEELIGYVNGSFAEIKIAQEAQWTYAEIYNRGINLLEFMAKRWSVKEYIDSFDFWQGADKESLLYLK